MEIKNGTVNDFEKAVDKYSDMVYRIAFNNLKCKGDSEDIVQEVFIALLKSAANYDNEEKLKAWLIRVTINKCKNLNKSLWRRSCVPPKNAKELYSQEEISLMEEISQLSEKDRNIIYLYYYEQYSIKEISQILNINCNTAGSRLRRARNKLKLMLKY